MGLDKRCFVKCVPIRNSSFRCTDQCQVLQPDFSVAFRAPPSRVCKGKPSTVSELCNKGRWILGYHLGCCIWCPKTPRYDNLACNSLSGIPRSHSSSLLWRLGNPECLAEDHWSLWAGICSRGKSLFLPQLNPEGLQSSKLMEEKDFPRNPSPHQQLDLSHNLKSQMVPKSPRKFLQQKCWHPFW